MGVARYLGLVLLVLSSMLSLSAGQQENGITTIKTADGQLLVWNQPDVYFTLEIKGNNVALMNSTEHVLMTVDGMVFQVQSAAIAQFMKDAEGKKRDDRSILVAHRDWEAEFIQSSLLNKKLTVQSMPQKLSNGGEALLWRFDMPEMPEVTKTIAKAQIYLTVVSGNHVLLLNGVVDGPIAESTVQKFLLDTISTLKVSSKPINVRELQESIRKANPQ